MTSNPISRSCLVFRARFYSNIISSHNVCIHIIDITASQCLQAHQGKHEDESLAIIDHIIAITIHLQVQKWCIDIIKIRFYFSENVLFKNIYRDKERALQSLTQSTYNPSFK